MLLAAAAVLAGCGANGPGAAPVPKGRTLQPFRNEAEFAAYPREVLERARRLDAQAPRPGMIDHPDPLYPLPQPPAPPDSPRAPVQSERPRPSSGGTRVALWGAALSGLSFLALFFGQRMAKDYAGAAGLVPYFLVSLVALLSLRG